MSTGAAAFRDAVERGDLDAALSVFADDVVFNSPVAHRPYHGKDALRAVLGAVFTVFENFRYTVDYEATDGGHVLVFRADVDGREIQGVDILSGPEADGRLTELTVMLRPYSGATAVKDRMAVLLGGSTA